MRIKIRRFQSPATLSLLTRPTLPKAIPGVEQNSTLRAKFCQLNMRRNIGKKPHPPRPSKHRPMRRVAWLTRGVATRDRWSSLGGPGASRSRRSSRTPAAQRRDPLARSRSRPLTRAQRPPATGAQQDGLSACALIAGRVLARAVG